MLDPETGKCLKTESDKREYEKGEGIATDGSVDVSPSIVRATAQILDRKLHDYIEFAENVLKDYSAAIQI